MAFSGSPFGCGLAAPASVVTFVVGYQVMSKTRLAIFLIVPLFSVALGFTVFSKTEPKASASHLDRETLKPTSRSSTFLFPIQTQDQATSTPKLEGCVSCHGLIEP
ncbi:MAG: hypothetical protein M3R52_03715, partial [Acidobacteriota bacterium]|nr:hypothetical protein [Acidobacteriota bacterium]